MTLKFPTVVIVHGAWVDGTSWREVIALLQGRGIRVVVAPVPLTSLGEDTEAVARVLQREQPPIVLVGHGYGGVVITQSGMHPNVTALVYVAAFAPDVDSGAPEGSREYPLTYEAPLRVDTEGFLYLEDETVAEYLAHDLPRPDGRVLAAAQKPIRCRALADRVTVAAWRTKPSWYVVAERDRMVSPDVQRRLALRINAQTISVEAGHLPFLSKPVETTAGLLAAVRYAQSQ
jgi:pimeloyl-ACP methyl ester carboxylesterase